MSGDVNRLVDRLAVYAIGVYALIAAGATTTITDSAAACGSWPACGTGPLTPALSIVWAHRLAAIGVGLLALWVTIHAWRIGARPRVRYALAGALALYPVQVGVGAVAAVAPAPSVSGLHLLLGVTIFGAVIAALAWSLEPSGEGSPSSTAIEPVDPAPEPTPDLGTSDGGLRGRVIAYVRLMKPRLMWLLCLVAAAGMALAAGPTLDLRTVGLTLGGGVLAIGASGTFNNAFERERDQKMARTADRPVATDRVPVRNAIAFGLVLAAGAVGLFLQVNLLAAALGAVAIVYYSVIYTLLLKPNTVQNTVIGGFAGSLPALIGWAAVSGTIGVPALALAGLIFLWTPAHFYNLAMAYKEDYAAGGYPMLPVVRGDDVARKHVLWYLGATLVAAVGLATVSRVDALVAIVSVGFGALFLAMAVRNFRERTRAAAMRTFHASNAYLGAVLVAVVIDALAL